MAANIFDNRLHVKNVNKLCTFANVLLIKKTYFRTIQTVNYLLEGISRYLSTFESVGMDCQHTGVDVNNNQPNIDRAKKRRKIIQIEKSPYFDDWLKWGRRAKLGKRPSFIFSTNTHAKHVRLCFLSYVNKKFRGKMNLRDLLLAIELLDVYCMTIIRNDAKEFREINWLHFFTVYRLAMKYNMNNSRQVNVGLFLDNIEKLVVGIETSILSTINYEVPLVTRYDLIEILADQCWRILEYPDLSVEDITPGVWEMFLAYYNFFFVQFFKINKRYSTNCFLTPRQKQRVLRKRERLIGNGVFQCCTVLFTSLKIHAAIAINRYHPLLMFLSAQSKVLSTDLEIFVELLCEHFAHCKA